VKYDLVGGHEVVCNDARMALPPDSFGAHYCSRALMPEIAQPAESSAEFFGHGIIGIIVKTLVLPKTIYCGRDVALGSKAAEGPQVLIPNLKTRQRCRKDISIELGISSGAGNSTNVSEELNANRSQQPHKLLDAMR
jgi:hypothetical protein